jgi:hypothetical protein
MASDFVEFEAKQTGVPEALRGVAAVQAVLRDTPRLFVRHSLPVVKRITRHTFATEGTSSGAPWPDVTEATKREKRRLLGRLPKILQREGRLYRSLVRRAHGDQVVTVTARTVRFGSRHPGFAAHQHGIAPNPERAPLKFTRDQIEEIVAPIVPEWQRAWDEAVR